MMHYCDIIIPVWNQLDFTRDCIENLIGNTMYPYRLILIDNASDGGTRQYLESLKLRNDLNIKLIRNEENLGFVKAVNQGLKISDAPYVAILNNDIIPAPAWLERMIGFADARDDIGLVNPQCDGHLNTRIDEYAAVLAKNEGKYMEMNQCHGFCMLVKRAVIDKIGYLDEAFGIGGFDDTDYSMRAHLAGYRCAAIGDAYVYHRLHGSFNKSGDREEWVKRNQKIYYDKWGKHLRVGIAACLDKIDENIISRLAMLCYGLAREWSWVYLWLCCNHGKEAAKRAVEKALAKSGLPPHQNIRIDYFDIPEPLFIMAIGGKLIERMRKRMRDKRFDAVITFDRNITAFISLPAKIVKAKVIEMSLESDTEDWLKRGSELARFIKNERDGYESGKM